MKTFHAKPKYNYGLIVQRDKLFFIDTSVKVHGSWDLIPAKVIDNIKDDT